MELAKKKGRNLQIYLGIPSDDVYNAFVSYKGYQNVPSLCELSTDKVIAINAKAWAFRWTIGIQEQEIINMHNQGRKCLAWTLDGREIVAAPGIGLGGSGSLWRIAADGSGNREHLAFTGDGSANPSLSRQGRRLSGRRAASRSLRAARRRRGGAELARPPSVVAPHHARAGAAGIHYGTCGGVDRVAVRRQPQPRRGRCQAEAAATARPAQL